MGQEQVKLFSTEVSPIEICHYQVFCMRTWKILVSDDHARHAIICERIRNAAPKISCYELTRIH